MSPGLPIQACVLEISKQWWVAAQQSQSQSTWGVRGAYMVLCHKDSEAFPSTLTQGKNTQLLLMLGHVLQQACPSIRLWSANPVWLPFRILCQYLQFLSEFPWICQHSPKFAVMPSAPLSSVELLKTKLPSLHSRPRESGSLAGRPRSQHKQFLWKDFKNPTVISMLIRYTYIPHTPLCQN